MSNDMTEIVVRRRNASSYPRSQAQPHAFQAEGMVPAMALLTFVHRIQWNDDDQNPQMILPRQRLCLGASFKDKWLPFGPLGPHEAEHSIVASEAGSDSSFVPSDPTSQAGHLRRRKKPLHQVYTGRVYKGSGRGSTASATLTSNPSILSLAPRESLTGQLSTIISFVRTLEHQVEQLPPHGETMTRNFLRNQANNLSKELVAIAKALEKLAT
ncbi:hypothetical protein QFC20_006569 [Naganishia adeliensis]|uniref:Uncharacterized protein n=1 Tax=Naganishia adeliensis TaxID=92952 RepID=A0ACC2V9Y3_9TREE|nr:hypothetical protein QFC20_006569 [Naganishia adeliensis]